MLLYGDSGNGKSSLINAGLLPRSFELGLHPERVRVQPRAGEEIVVERITVSDDGSELLPSLLAREGDDALRLVLSVEAFEERVRDACATHRPLLVFDQFEEILTLFEGDEGRASRERLIETIVRLLREPLPVKLLFAFREDYLGKVKQLLAACPELVDQALRLGPPQAGALPAIICGPFERHPGHFARELGPALAERLRAALEERFGAGDLSLSEVQTVCLRLWQAGGDPEALLAQKGVQGLLEDYLGEALEMLAPDVRDAAVALLSQMVTSAGTRNVIAADDLVQRVRAEDDIPPPVLQHALEQLESESKLVRRERRRDLFLYEITSEFLVPWISRRREELRRVQERRRERRRLLVLGSIAGALIVVAAVIAVVAVWALKQRSEAEQRGVDLQRKVATATSLALASSARGSLISERPDVSLLLAFEAYREDPLPEARGAIIQSLRAAGRPAVVGILRGHTSRTNSVTFSPDRRILATASEDGTVRLWDTRTHKQLARLTANKRAVLGVAFSPDRRTLATASANGKVRLWDTRTHKQLATLTANKRAVNGVAFSPDRRTLATAGDDGTARLWDTRTHKQLAILTRRTRSITTSLYTSPLYASRIYSVAFSPDRRTLATASANGKVRLWDTHTHKQLASFSHSDRVRSVALSPDGRTLATASDDNTARLWDTRTHRKLADLTGHTGDVYGVAFSPGGRTIATASDDNTARLWDTRTHKQLARLPHDDHVRSVAFSPDGRTLATVGIDSAVRLWDTRALTRFAPFTGHAGWVRGVALSPDGRTLATASEDNTARLWDIRTHKQLARLGHADDDFYLGSVAYSPNGRILATVGIDWIRLWDTRTHKELRHRTGYTYPATGVAFSPDGRTLATASDENTVLLWDTHTDKLATLRGHTSYVNDVAFSPDGRTIATASQDRTAGLWDTRTHKQLARLGHTSAVLGVAFSPNGHTIATTSDDDTARLWDARTHKRFARLTGHASAVFGVAFSPDGRTLATASSDNRVFLWDTRSHKQLARLSGHTGDVFRVAFSSDGRMLASASADMSARLWTDFYWKDDTELRDRVCGLVGRGLSRAEWNRYVTDIPYHNSCP